MSESNDEMRNVPAAILFVDIEESVAYTQGRSNEEYVALLRKFSSVAHKVCTELNKTGVPSIPKPPFVVSIDCSVNGDEARIIVLPRDSSERSYVTCDYSYLVYIAFVAAIRIKYEWMLSQYEGHKKDLGFRPIPIALGIHTGDICVYELEHAEGNPKKVNYEGYPISLAKRMESSSRQGRHTHIVMSNTARSYLLKMTIGKSTLKQFIFFEALNVPRDVLKGIPGFVTPYEVRYYTRIEDLTVLHTDDKEDSANESRSETPEIRPKPSEDRRTLMGMGIDELTRLIYEPEGYSSYNMLSEQAIYEAHKDKMEEKGSLGYELAESAYYAFGEDAKVLLDLAYFNWMFGNYELSIKYSLQSLKINPELDIAYQISASSLRQRIRGMKREHTLDEDKMLIDWAEMAVCISPDSATNHYQLGYAYHMLKLKHFSKEDPECTPERNHYHNLAEKHIRHTIELFRAYQIPFDIGREYGLSKSTYIKTIKG